MKLISSREQLEEVLARPWPVARAEGLFQRAPEVVCHLAAQTLGEVARLHCGPGALVWRDGVVRHDLGAAVAARLRASVWSDTDGEPFFAGERADLLGALPAGVLDRLLLAADQASGYRPCDLGGTASDGGLTARYAENGRWVPGLLPMAPEAALYVGAYDFAALAEGEAAAMLSLPGGGEARVEVLAYPALVAASLRCGVGRDAAPLVDEPLARQLPYGACRAVVELADALSEMGGPAAAIRFLDQRTGPQPDGSVPLAAAADGALPQ